MNYPAPVASVIREYAERLSPAPQILREGFAWSEERQVWLPSNQERQNPHLLQIESRSITSRRASDSAGNQTTVEETSIVLAYLIAAHSAEAFDQNEVEAMKQVRTLLNRIQNGIIAPGQPARPSQQYGLHIPAFTSQPYYNSAGIMEAGVVFTITFQRADPFASCI